MKFIEGNQNWLQVFSSSLTEVMIRISTTATGIILITGCKQTEIGKLNSEEFEEKLIRDFHNEHPKNQDTVKKSGGRR